MSHDPRADKIHRDKASSTSQNSNNQSFKSGQNKRSPQCARVQARLLAYLDGTVSARERASLQQHLDICARCRQELAVYQASEQALSGALSAVPPAGDLRAAFYARLTSEPAPKTSRLSWMNWRLAVPALAACSLLAGWLTVPHQRQAPQIARRAKQENRIARSDQNNSVTAAPEDVNREKQTIRPASPANEPIARVPVALPPVRLGSLSDIRRVSPKLSRNTGTRRKPADLLSAGVELGRKIGSPDLGVKRAMSADGDRTGLGYKTSRSANNADKPEANRLAYLNKTQQSDTDQVKLSGMLGTLADSKVQTNTRFFAHGEQNNALYYQTVVPPPNYAFSSALTLRGDSLFKDRNENMPSLSTAAPGLPSSVLSVDASNNRAAIDRFDAAGSNAEDSRANGTDNSSSDNSSSDNGIAIQVRDSRRGFTSSLRLASRVQRRDGKQVLTIHMEDTDENASSAAAYTPLPGEVRMEPK